MHVGKEKTTQMIWAKERTLSSSNWASIMNMVGVLQLQYWATNRPIHLHPSNFSITAGSASNCMNCTQSPAVNCKRRPPPVRHFWMKPPRNGGNLHVGIPPSTFCAARTQALPDKSKTGPSRGTTSRGGAHARAHLTTLLRR